MMNPKFTIVLVHYNQMNYIYEALDSIINQSYDNIQLIITDDASEKFDKDKIEKYVLKKSKIKDLNFVVNKENIGTTKTLNKSLKLVKGDYLLFFAADDTLYDENVIQNYVDTFQKHTSEYIVTSQCYMYDKELKNKMYNYVSEGYEKQFNNFSTNQIFNEICKKSLFASGSTAYRKELFNKMGNFDENYKYVEDWPFHIKCARQGIKTFYEPFVGLKHRDGGISNYNVRELPKHVIQYYIDICNTYANEIMPYVKLSSMKKIMENYNSISEVYKKNIKIPIRFSIYVNLFNMHVFMISLYKKFISLIFTNQFILFNILLLQFLIINDDKKSNIIFNYYCLVLLILIIIWYILKIIKKVLSL